MSLFFVQLLAYCRQLSKSQSRTKTINILKGDQTDLKKTFQIQLFERRFFYFQHSANSFDSPLQGIFYLRNEILGFLDGSLTGFLVPLLTTNVSCLWFHSRPKTCKDSFESTGGSICSSSGKFPTNFVSLNPPFCSRQVSSLLRCKDSFLDGQLSR